MTRRHRGQPSSLSYVLTTVTAAASAMTILPTVQSRAGSSPFVNTESQQVLGTPFTARIDDEEVTTSAGALYSNCDDLSYITGPMYEADADMNGFLDKEEYVEFTNTLSAGYLTIQGWDDGFTDMPLSLQETYLVLSCLCELYPNEPWGGKGCCESDPGIRTDGTAPGEILDEEQRQYLTYVCEPMSESLEDVGALVVPPTRAPVMTDMPTTEIPTKSPTLEQTKKPTELPTSEPTKTPVTLPSVAEPTKNPTSELTYEPSNRPTKRPSLPPSSSPSVSPVEPDPPTKSPVTKSPTESPVDTTSPTKQTTRPPVNGISTTEDVTPKPTAEVGSTTQAPVDATTPTEKPTPKPVDETAEPSITKAPPDISTPTPEELYYDEWWADLPLEIQVAYADLGYNETMWNEAIKPDSDEMYWDALSPEMQEAALFIGYTKEIWDTTSAPTASPTTAPVQDIQSPISPVVLTDSPTVTVSFGPTAQPPSSPSESPSVSTEPSYEPSSRPSQQPSVSFASSVSSSPSSSPTSSSPPTSSNAPTAVSFTGDVPANIGFVAILSGQVNASELMLGTTNQVKVMLEEQLLVLSGIVIEEEFRGNATTADGNATTTSTATRTASNINSPSKEPMLRRRARERMLVVEKATSATVNSVRDVSCPEGVPRNATQCLNFSNSVLLYMVDERKLDEQVEIFESAMLAKIGDGWLVDNFDLEEALKPPPVPSSGPTPSKDPDGVGVGGGSDPLESSLSVGAIIGVIVLVLACLFMTVFFTGQNQRNKNDSNVDAARKKRRHQWMKFTSALLFVIGSVLYLVMAVMDFQWAHELQTLPMWLRTADDDFSWVNYGREERYNASLLEGAARAGGVRRMKTRELRLEEENQALGAKAARNKVRAISLVRTAQAVASPAESSERKLQTPEGLYYNLCWADLPQEIQDAYAVLGYNETMWNEAIKPESDEMYWDELSPEMQKTALFIGYTKEMWDTTSAPTASPIPVQSPTSPTLLEVTSAPVEALQPNPAPISPSSSNAAVNDPVVPASPTPGELYYDEFWKDLPQDIQDAYAVLGYTEKMWCEAIKPETDETYWDELTPEQRKAALFIGYTKEIWDTTSTPAASPIASLTNATDITVSDTTNAPEDNIDEIKNTETVAAGYYDNYTWVELPRHTQEAAATLGYNQNLWDSGGLSWSDDYFWDELTPVAQEAAALLGYDKYSWDGIDPITGDAVEADDDYVSYDDDYVFQVGSSDVWVSKYQILYFSAALSFVIVGILDLIRERHVFHILMILAGAFGLASAVYIEEDIRLSNIFNSVSVHFYLLEAITLFGDHKRGAIAVEVVKWMEISIMFGDLAFIVGSFMDVVLSYFFLFDDTADWDLSLAITSIAAAVLWLLCSLIYIVAFFYEYHEAKNEECHREEEGERGSLASLARLEEAADNDIEYVWTLEDSDVGGSPKETVVDDSEESV